MNVEITSLETRPDEYCACFCVTFPGGAEYRVGGQIPLADGKGLDSEAIAKLCWEKAAPLVDQFVARFIDAPAPVVKPVEVSLDELPEETPLGDGLVATKPPPPPEPEVELAEDVVEGVL